MKKMLKLSNTITGRKLNFTINESKGQNIDEIKNVIETLNNVQTQLDTLVKETHKEIIDTRVAFEKADNDNIKFWKG